MDIIPNFKPRIPQEKDGSQPDQLRELMKLKWNRNKVEHQACFYTQQKAVQDYLGKLFKTEQTNLDTHYQKQKPIILDTQCLAFTFY